MNENKKIVLLFIKLYSSVQNAKSEQLFTIIVWTIFLARSCPQAKMWQRSGQRIRYIECFDAMGFKCMRWWFPVLSRATVLELVYFSYLRRVITAIVFFVWFHSYMCKLARLYLVWQETNYIPIELFPTFAAELFELRNTYLFCSMALPPRQSIRMINL